MIKKTITFLLLISLIYTINLNKVNAFTISIPSFGEEEGETEGDGWKKGDAYNGDTSEERRTIYQCYYKTNIRSSSLKIFY